MLKKLKRALVESFVGAIMLGWVFAQAVLHCAYIFISPGIAWFQHSMYRAYLPDRTPVSFSFTDIVKQAAPDFLRAVALLVVGFILLRWLYFIPPAPEREAEVPQ